ncbi:MAG: hypothetical protein JWN38_305 [Candidatus Saccharibacteria bacterium]|nr:hypothetical protein [Candidatus Saccharibacteria bacterium]
MEKQKSTYLFALEVTPLKVGKTYDTLPLHCTLMHRFLSEKSADELVKHTEKLLDNTSQIVLVPGDHVPFGPRHKLANRLKLTKELLALHMALYDLLIEVGVHFTEADWVGKGYTPHVSDQKGVSLPTRGSTVSSAVYLIEVEHPLDGTHRFVRHKFGLRP